MEPLDPSMKCFAKYIAQNVDNVDKRLSYLKTMLVPQLAELDQLLANTITVIGCIHHNNIQSRKSDKSLVVIGDQEAEVGSNHSVLKKKYPCYLETQLKKDNDCCAATVYTL